MQADRTPLRARTRSPGWAQSSMFCETSEKSRENPLPGLRLFEVRVMSRSSDDLDLSTGDRLGHARGLICRESSLPTNNKSRALDQLPLRPVGSSRQRLQSRDHYVRVESRHEPLRRRLQTVTPRSRPPTMATKEFQRMGPRFERDWPLDEPLRDPLCAGRIGALGLPPGQRGLAPTWGGEPLSGTQSTPRGIGRPGSSAPSRVGRSKKPRRPPRLRGTCGGGVARCARAAAGPVPRRGGCL